jgi:hypothetical protein
VFTAQDPNGPGIYNVTVTVDGQPVYNQIPDTNGGQCQSVGTDGPGVLEFLSAQPCRQTIALRIPVDTSKLAAGAHQLTVSETDAAGNTATVYSQTITTSHPNVPNGTPCAHPTLSLTANRKPTCGLCDGVRGSWFGDGFTASRPRSTARASPCAATERSDR